MQMAPFSLQEDLLSIFILDSEGAQPSKKAGGDTSEGPGGTLLFSLVLGGMEALPWGECRW